MVAVLVNPFCSVKSYASSEWVRSMKKESPADSTTLPRAAQPDGNRRILLVNSGCMFATFASANVLPAICLVQIAAQFGLSDAQCGLLFAVGPMITFVALPLFGLLAERLGKQWLLAGGLALLAVALEIYRVADGYALLLLGSATMGVASAVFDALASPLVVDLYPRRTAPVMNLIHCCFQIGLVLTAVGVGIYLARGGLWTGAFLPATLLAVLLAVVFASARFPPAVEREAPHGVASLLRQGPFWLCAVGMAVAGGVEAGVVNWVSSFLQREFDLTAAGRFLTEHLALAEPEPLLGAGGIALFSGPMIVGRWFYGSIAERFGYRPTLLASCGISALALGGLGLTTTATASVIWLAILGLALSGMWPTILAYASATISARPPTLFALLSMAGLLGVAGCSWGIGRAADAFGLQAGLTLLILPVLAGLAAFAALPRSIE